MQDFFVCFYCQRKYKYVIVKTNSLPPPKKDTERFSLQKLEFLEGMEFRHNHSTWVFNARKEIIAYAGSYRELYLRANIFCTLQFKYLNGSIIHLSNKSNPSIKCMLSLKIHITNDQFVSPFLLQGIQLFYFKINKQSWMNELNTMSSLHYQELLLRLC